MPLYLSTSFTPRSSRVNCAGGELFAEVETDWVCAEEGVGGSRCRCRQEQAAGGCRCSCGTHLLCQDAGGDHKELAAYVQDLAALQAAAHRQKAAGGRWGGGAGGSRAGQRGGSAVMSSAGASAWARRLGAAHWRLAFGPALAAAARHLYDCCP
jgi:hypothetical protein